MEIKHIVSHIKYLTSLDDSTDHLDRHLGHAAEELGEVAKARRNLRYAKTPEAEAEIRKNLIEETVDLAITAFATYISAGGKPDQFYEILMRKCSKWENNVKQNQD